MLLLGGIGAGVVAASWVVGVVNDTPDIESIRPKPAGAISTVYAADGTRLGFIAGGDTLRTPVDGTKIPNALKQATVAIEDKRFYKHRGVDYVGVLRAAVKNVTDDAASQGGSTLTMQLVRNLYIPENRFRKDLTRKIRRRSWPTSSRSSTRKSGYSSTTSTTCRTRPSAARRRSACRRRRGCCSTRTSRS